MCQWNAQCSDVNNQCVSGPPTLGCSKSGSSCETCALGRLTRLPTKTLTHPHKSPYSTLGKLRPNKGWEITRPGKDTDLAKGDLITEINGLPLDQDLDTAKRTIIELYKNKEKAVMVTLLSPRGRKIQRPFTRR